MPTRKIGIGRGASAITVARLVAALVGPHVEVTAENIQRAKREYIRRREARGARSLHARKHHNKPHQSAREKDRRVRQMASGFIRG